MGTETAYGAREVREVRRRAKGTCLVGRKAGLRHGERARSCTRSYRKRGTCQRNLNGARKRATGEIGGGRRECGNGMRGGRGQGVGNCGRKPTHRGMRGRSRVRAVGYSPGAERGRARTGTQGKEGPRGPPLAVCDVPCRQGKGPLQRNAVGKGGDGKQKAQRLPGDHWWRGYSDAEI